MSFETRAQYYLVTKNSMLGGCTGLNCGDVLAVYEGGASSVMRHVAYGPPVGLRARLEADGTLTPLEPKVNA